MSNIDEKNNEMHINNILHDHAAIQIKKKEKWKKNASRNNTLMQNVAFQ